MYGVDHEHKSQVRVNSVLQSGWIGARQFKNLITVLEEHVSRQGADSLHIGDHGKLVDVDVHEDGTIIVLFGKPEFLLDYLIIRRSVENAIRTQRIYA